MLVDSLRSAISKEPKYRERLRKIYLPLITFGANILNMCLGTERI